MTKTLEYRLGYSDGWRDGVLYAARMMDTYLLPAERAIADMNNTATFIAGVACTGAGELPRTILRDANTALGAEMSRAINAVAHARGEGRLNINKLDLADAQGIFERVAAFLDDDRDNGDALRDYLQQLNPTLQPYVAAHQALKPGRRAGDLVTFAGQWAHELRQHGHTYHQIARIMLRELQARPAANRSDTETALLHELEHVSYTAQKRRVRDWIRQFCK